MRDKLIRLLAFVVLPLLIIELCLGYLNFRLFTRGSAVRHSYRMLVTQWKQSRETYEAPKGVNPFFTAAHDTGYALHPLLGYTRGTALYPFKPDYFGFRNARDLYFDKERKETLIVMTGGSEAAGYSHEVPIIQNVERILNARHGKKFRVLNLAMNGYCLPQEMAAYLNLAYDLHPEFVISHSGYNDTMYALMAPGPFKELGLFFSKDVFESWLEPLYGAKPGRNYGAWTLEKDRAEVIVPSILRSLEKYRNVVVHNGGKFIVGIQPYFLPEHLKVPPADLARAGTETFEKLLAEAPARDFLTFPKELGITFKDHIHTTSESSEKIARVYAEQISKAMQLAALPGGNG